MPIEKNGKSTIPKKNNFKQTKDDVSCEEKNNGSCHGVVSVIHLMKYLILFTRLSGTDIIQLGSCCLGNTR